MQKTNKKGNQNQMTKDKDQKAKETSEKRKEVQAAPSGKRSNAAATAKGRPSGSA
jgi:hypothetical protein